MRHSGVISKKYRFSRFVRFPGISSLPLEQNVARKQLLRVGSTSVARTTLRVPNIMKHVCVAARTVDNAKDDEADIANISKESDKVSGRFWLQPFGLARLFAHLCVVLLGHILDMAVVALLDLSENRDSASRVSWC